MTYPLIRVEVNSSTFHLVNFSSHQLLSTSSTSKRRLINFYLRVLWSLNSKIKYIITNKKLQLTTTVPRPENVKITKTCPILMKLPPNFSIFQREFHRTKISNFRYFLYFYGRMTLNGRFLFSLH